MIRYPWDSALVKAINTTHIEHWLSRATSHGVHFPQTPIRGKSEIELAKMAYFLQDPPRFSLLFPRSGIPFLFYFIVDSQFHGKTS